MEALILSCGTGGGHNAAGMAVAEELRRRGHQVEMRNPYTLKSHRLSNGIDRVYISLVQRVPHAFGFIYLLGNLYRRLPFRSPVYFINRKMVAVMEQYLAEHHFDVVIMPHLFPAEILSNMKELGISVPKTIFIATDYTCTPFTEETDCDAYVTPSPMLADDFCRRGIAADKLHPLGIPTKAQFHAAISPYDAKVQLGLATEQQYVLVAGGSMGAGSLVRIVKLLLTNLKNGETIIVVCGSNERLYNRLQAKFGSRLILVRQTDQMALYMKASELVLTKPGGLSSTEAAVAQTGLLHITPIPGCETRNMRFFAQHGLSIPIRHPKRQLAQACTKLSDPDEKSQMTQNQGATVNPHAAADICDLAEMLAGQTQPVSC